MGNAFIKGKDKYNCKAQKNIAFCIHLNIIGYHLEQTIF